jgi:hypothetical protein
MSKPRPSATPPRPVDRGTTKASHGAVPSHQEFVMAATGPSNLLSQQPPLPWESPAVRADRRVALNTRIPEPLAAKLDYIVRFSDKLTKQQVVEDALETHLDHLIAHMGVQR